jgi:hypothetical protein
VRVEPSSKGLPIVPPSPPPALSSLVGVENAVGARDVVPPVTVLHPRDQFVVSCRVVWSDDTVDEVTGVVHAWTPHTVLVTVNHHTNLMNHLVWLPASEVIIRHRVPCRVRGDPFFRVHRAARRRCANGQVEAASQPIRK